MSNTANDGFSIEAITNKDRQAVIEFLDKYFHRDEPLCNALELLDDIRAKAKSDAINNSLLDNGLACKAVSSDGHLIGVIANSVKCKFDKHGDDAEDDTKFQHITKFLNKIGKETNFFYQYPNVCRALTIDILSVDDKYRGKGVCKSLMDKARELALKNRCSMIYVGCSSYFSAKAAERLGFQCIYTMSYEDYLNDKGQQMFNPPTPHTHFKVYVLPLDND
ncbi:arylalkylamine N-acetyltransferase 1-like isoform X1 [Adelges cooleyi]|uniref:arylalkylamine N-acetyltransferase 1-like isoform X1 n=1 Tax=Adelges cooleyi TaxID=133065 RepID=UPI0021808760|nr:arylalkylamine N-acetyltransferase 1-like isoform X1 [Adelges cooleyi]XP_050433456.1 arylalkylamine N-acetyltransferase 1-like isoform X1 [Adelges cooleyi]XP_050433457.1 arylalkylamine N-acetyltransferase 1-like isoform X1 [Adelges cooleyi]